MSSQFFFLKSSMHGKAFLSALLLCLILSGAVVVNKSSAAGSVSPSVASYSPASLNHIRQSNGGIGRGAVVSQKKESTRLSSRAERAFSGRRVQHRQTRPGGGLHAHEWAFGGGQSALRWTRGIDGDTLQKKALGNSKKRAELASNVNESTSLDEHNGIRITIDQQGQNWSVHPSDEQVDENIPLEKQHRVRALAGVSNKDLSFGLGPQVILKDSQQVRERMAKTDQPGVDPGVGMQLKMDF